MRTRALSFRLVVPAALVVLVALLATLQYRWLGEVSRAERERLHASLRAQAQDFADAFDAEVLWIQLAFQTAGPVTAGDGEVFARAFDAWRDQARYPQLVRDVFLLEGNGDAETLRRFDRAARRFVDEAWPADLAPLRARVLTLQHLGLPAAAPTVERAQPASSEGKPRDLLPGARELLMLNDPIVASIPAMLIALPTVQSRDAPSRTLVSVHVGDRFLVVRLDRDAIRTTILPALAAQYFAGREADAYRIAVLDRSRDARTPAAPVFTRGVPEGTRIDAGHADASIPLLAVRFELGARVMPRLGLPIAAQERPAGDGSQGTNDARPNGLQQMGIVVHKEPEASGGQPGVPALPVSPAGSVKTDTVAIYVQSRSARDNVFRVSSSAAPAGAWQLLLQHPAGSLEAAVGQARRRNLWLSFGILAVLAAGVVLVVVNAQRAERLAVQQMDFVATVSHELRTPLAVIRSAAQNLSAGVVQDAARTRHYGEMIDSEGRRLGDMVEQVLAYAGLGGNRKPATSERLDIGVFVRDVCGGWTAMNQAPAVTLDVRVEDNLPAVHGDQMALRRLLNNLIVNAVKYGGESGWVGVTVRHARTRGGRDEVEIAVQDRGRGIPAGELSHVFEPFYRGRAAVERQVPGNGLGLSLVKGIVEAHGGRVTARSSAGQGAVFTVHLPGESGSGGFSATAAS